MGAAGALGSFLKWSGNHALQALASSGNQGRPSSHTSNGHIGNGAPYSGVDLKKADLFGEKGSPAFEAFERIGEGVNLGMEAANGMRGQDFYAVIGRTRAGKSTLLNSLAGKKLVLSGELSRKERHVTPGLKKLKVEGTAVSEIGCSADSRTAVPHLCEINSMKFVDFPGFSDSRRHNNPAVALGAQIAIEQGLKKSGNILGLCLVITNHGLYVEAEGSDYNAEAHVRMLRESNLAIEFPNSNQVVTFVSRTDDEDTDLSIQDLYNSDTRKIIEAHGDVTNDSKLLSQADALFQKAKCFKPLNLDNSASALSAIEQLQPLQMRQGTQSTQNSGIGNIYGDDVRKDLVSIMDAVAVTIERCLSETPVDFQGLTEIMEQVRLFAQPFDTSDFSELVASKMFVRQAKLGISCRVKVLVW